MNFHQRWTRCHTHKNPNQWRSLTVTTAETHHPLPHCAHIQRLVSINVQQVLMNVNGCHFFCTEEFSPTALLHMHFHVRHYFVSAPLLPSATCSLLTARVTTVIFKSISCSILLPNLHRKKMSRLALPVSRPLICSFLSYSLQTFLPQILLLQVCLKWDSSSGTKVTSILSLSHQGI